MAARNTAPYLPDCLQSILNQTYPHWELLAVNDRSSDDTRKILEEYAALDNRIKVFDSRGERLIPALQEGFRQSSGMLINRMDSDDRMPENKLSLLVNAWLKHGKGTVIAGGTEHFVEEGIVGEGFRRYEEWLNEVARTGSHYEQIYKECVIPSHSWIIHRDDLKTVGAFDPDVYPEDYDLCFRFYEAGLRVEGIDHVLHYWRDRSDRISRTWEEYKDNRYFDLKLDYFYKLDRDLTRELVIWGAGKNGKDLIKEVLKRNDHPIWVCDNARKIGKHIYGLKLHASGHISMCENPQILIAVSSDTDRQDILSKLTKWNKLPVRDYWFFL
jgi:glycosyltransferase involved in cell wall biosynthesis